MTSLFKEQNSDNEEKLKINTGYANSYNSWRQKEEFSKLKTKYGEHIKDSDDESETSSDEDEEGAELTEQVEKDFYKTLACLKNKDPKIYDNHVKFFDDRRKDNENGDEPDGTSKKSKKEKKLFLRDYERQIVMERGGKFSDSEDEDTFLRKKRESHAPTYVEEQQALKESISKALDDDAEEDEEMGLLKPKAKSEEEKLKDEETYKEWLKGQQLEIDSSEKQALKPLRDFWTDPNLDPKEKFLRDYVLNKKFLGKDGEEDYIEYDQIAHDSDENLSEDEKNIEKQEEFEHKYNFRFEEPDQEFIKRYPRTLQDTLRKKDTRRSQKRAEVKQRKEEDKIRKREELKQLKAMKRKEIEEKIEKLKEITGNDDIRFDNIDLDADFDPAEHDKKMQELFNEEYYAEEGEDMKPEFPEIDEELGIDKDWDDYDPSNDVFVPDADDNRADNPDCEDPEFNMDADYDPTKSFQSELIDASRKKKKRRRSKFAEVIAKEKPKFDPSVHSSYRDYIEQYYALDYEDMIDDLPCRFKYRKVVPNDYGLSVEEILMADDRELNKWCSLKRALEHKSEERELREVLSYKQKASNEAVKRKILTSLYTPEEETQDPETAIMPLNQNNEEPAKKKRKPKKKKRNAEVSTATKAEETKPSEGTTNGLTVEKEERADNKVLKKKKQKKVKVLTDTLSVDNEAEEPTIEVPKSTTEKTKKRKANKLPKAIPETNEEDSEEPRDKKSKQEKSSPQNSKTDGTPISSGGKGQEVSRKKLKKDNYNEEQFGQREAERNLDNSENANATSSKKLNKKQKKQSSVEVPKSTTEKTKKRKANKLPKENPQTNEEDSEEPRIKKSKQENSSTKKSKTDGTPISSGKEGQEVSRKKLKKDNHKEKQFARREAERNLGNSENANATSSKKLNKKNKKQSSGASGSKKQFNNKNSTKDTDQVASLSSERLKAYGLNPKKFKNKLKYGKQK